MSLFDILVLETEIAGCVLVAIYVQNIHSEKRKKWCGRFSIKNLSQQF